MEVLKIEYADIMLDDKGEGKGKVTVSDTQFYTSSYYWGAMGMSLREFLKKINSDYFAGKMCSKTYQNDSKKTVKNIRKYIREEMAYDLPWYKFMNEQKELRRFLKELEGYDCNTIVEMLFNIKDYFICEDEEFVKIIDAHLSVEPFHFIGQTVTPEYEYFKKLHSKLKKAL